PLFGEIRYGRVVRIDGHQAIEGDFLHAESRGDLGESRIECVRVHVQADAQRAAALTLRGLCGGWLGRRRGGLRWRRCGLSRRGRGGGLRCRGGGRRGIAYWARRPSRRYRSATRE